MKLKLTHDRMMLESMSVSFLILIDKYPEMLPQICFTVIEYVKLFLH